MNSKFIASAVIALSALTGASAFAQGIQVGEAAHVFKDTSISTKTRAQVNAEYAKARSEGSLPANAEGSYVAVQTPATTLSRAEVRANGVVSAQSHLTDGRNAS